MGICIPRVFYWSIWSSSNSFLLSHFVSIFLVFNTDCKCTQYPICVYNYFWILDMVKHLWYVWSCKPYHLCVSYRYHNLYWNICLLMDIVISSGASDVALQLILDWFGLLWNTGDWCGRLAKGSIWLLSDVVISTKTKRQVRMCGKYCIHRVSLYTFSILWYILSMKVCHNSHSYYFVGQFTLCKKYSPTKCYP